MATETLGMGATVPGNGMMLDPLGLDSVVPDDNMMLDPLAMDYPWNVDGYRGLNGIAPQPFNPANKSSQYAFAEGHDQSSFADAMSSFTNLQPTMQEQFPPAPTVDPTYMWQQPHTIPSSHTSNHSSQLSSPIVKIEDDELPKRTPETAPSPAESDSSLRARHAANERHNQTKKARRDSQQSDGTGSATDKKKVRLREKNKVAAAKCRQRQRRQAQSIQEKGGRLSEANAQLKASVQELRGELNGLRAIALYHQGCNCQVAKYNYNQAERLAAEYNSTYTGHRSPDCSVHSAEPSS